MQQRPFPILADAGVDVRDRYRWLLLAGWLALITTVSLFVIAPPHHVRTVDELLIALAAVAFVVYNMAIKRYWIIALGFFIAFNAVMWSIVV